jgi:hypothetical protein
MQIYSFTIHGKVFRLYGKIIVAYRYKGQDFTIYEDFKGLKWLYVEINSKGSLLPWVKESTFNQYVQRLQEVNYF